MNESSDNKLLVISEIGIGDALTLTPALRGLRKQHPGISIQMFAPGIFSLKENFCELAEILDHRELAQASLEAKHAWLRGQGFRWVWNTENEKSAWRQVLSMANNPAWISAPPHRTWPRRPVLILRQQQFQQLFPALAPEGDPLLVLTAAQEDERRRFRARFAQGQRLIALQPTANDPTKIWPAEKFCELASRLAAPPQTTVVLFLDAAARKTFNETVLRPPQDLITLTEPLGSAIAKLAACDLFIGNDSGFYHLAFALGLQVVGIYRSRRNAQVWSYRSPRSRGVYFYLPSMVRRHWGRYLSVHRVMRAVQSLI